MAKNWHSARAALICGSTSAKLWRVTCMGGCGEAARWLEAGAGRQRWQVHITLVGTKDAGAGRRQSAAAGALFWLAVAGLARSQEQAGGREERRRQAMVIPLRHCIGQSGTHLHLNGRLHSRSSSTDGQPTPGHSGQRASPARRKRPASRRCTTTMESRLLCSDPHESSGTGEDPRQASHTHSAALGEPV